MVQNGEVFLDRPRRAPLLKRSLSLGAVDTLGVIDIGPDQAGIDGKGLAADKSGGNTALHHSLEQPAQQIGVAKARVTGARTK